MVLTEVAVGLLALALGVLGPVLLGARPARCSECNWLGLVTPASAPRRCRFCPTGLLAYPPSVLSGLLVRPAVLKSTQRRRRR